MEPATQQIEPQQETEQQRSHASEQQRKEKKAVAFGIWLSEWLTAGAVGLVSGVLTSAQKVNDLFHEDARNASGFSGHFNGYTPKSWREYLERKYEVARATHNKANGTSIESAEWMRMNKDAFNEELKQPLKQGIKERLNDIDLKNFLKEGKTPGDYRKAIRTEKHVIAKDFANVAYAYRGIRKNPILGTIDKLETLSDRSIRMMSFNGAIGAAIGAAMTVSFFNGVATRDKIDKIAERNNPDTGMSK